MMQDTCDTHLVISAKLSWPLPILEPISAEWRRWLGGRCNGNIHDCDGETLDRKQTKNTGAQLRSRWSL